MIQKDIFKHPVDSAGKAYAPKFIFLAAGLMLSACGNGRDSDDMNVEISPRSISRDLENHADKALSADPLNNENSMEASSASEVLNNDMKDFILEDEGAAAGQDVDDPEPEDETITASQDVEAPEPEGEVITARQDAEDPEPKSEDMDLPQDGAASYSLPADTDGQDAPPETRERDQIAPLPSAHTVRIASKKGLQGLHPANRVRRNFLARAEYSANLSAFDRIKIRPLYEAGATGHGVIIGVVDDFLYAGHVEFMGMLSDVENKRRIEITTADGEDWFISVGFSLDDPPFESKPYWINHGTKIAGMLAGRHDELGHSGNMHGLAYESSVIFRSYYLTGAVPGRVAAPLLSVLEREGEGHPASVLDVPDELNHLSKLRDIALASAFMDVINGGAHIVNAAVGFGGALFHFDSGAPGVAKENIIDALPNIVQALRSARGKALIVFAAGNQRRNRPALSPVLPYALQFYFEELRDHVVTVIAVRPKTGKVSSFSNFCGVAAEWCIAAPGEGLRAPTLFQRKGEILDDAYTYSLSGTSAAVPVVAGGLALLIDHFGLASYTVTDILNRLYATADKKNYSASGGPDYSNSAIYGQGLMDLTAAFQPFGAEQFLIGDDLHSAQRFDLAQSRIIASAAFGDSFVLSLAGRRAVFFDALDFAFEMDASAYIVPAAGEAAAAGAAAAVDLSARLARLGRDIGWLDEERPAEEFSFFSGYGNPGEVMRSNLMPPAFLSLTENALHGGIRWRFGDHDFSSLLFASAEEDAEDAENDAADQIYGLGLAYNFTPGFGSFALDAGFVREAEGLLLSQFDGPFALSSGSQTFFVGFGGAANLLGSWKGIARANLGWTDSSAAAAAAGGLSGVTDILSSSWMMGFYRRGFLKKPDRFSLILSQPLRVERGRMSLHYAIGRMADGSLILATRRNSLAPSGRALDLEAKYQFSWRSASMALAAGYMFQRGHDRNAKGEARVLARLSFSLQ